MSGEIKGIKAIRVTGQINHPDDPSYPFKLEVSLSPPKFMDVAFIFLHGGSEDVVVRGMTAGALEEFIRRNDLERHSRLRSLKITGPNGVVREMRR